MEPESERRGWDGAIWILEGLINDRYHAVARWCPNTLPEQHRGFATACQSLAETVESALPELHKKRLQFPESLPANVLDKIKVRPPFLNNKKLSTSDRRAEILKKILRDEYPDQL